MQNVKTINVKLFVVKMRWKNFFSSNIRKKVIIFIILVIVFPAISMYIPQCSIDSPCPISYNLVFFSLPIQIYNYFFIYWPKSMTYYFPSYILQLLINLSASYFLSSLIINFIKQKQK